MNVSDALWWSGFGLGPFSPSSSLGRSLGFRSLVSLVVRWSGGSSPRLRFARRFVRFEVSRGGLVALRKFVQRTSFLSCFVTSCQQVTHVILSVLWPRTTTISRLVTMGPCENLNIMIHGR